MESWRRAAIALMIAATGFTAGRATHRREDRPSVPTAPEPPPAPSPTGATAADSASRLGSSRPAAPTVPTPPPDPERARRESEIAAELSALPADDSAAVAALRAGLDRERGRANELRERLAAADRALVDESLRASMGPGHTRDRLAFEERVASLQGRLTDAKIAVAQQQRSLDYLRGSSEGSPYLLAGRAELAKLNARVSALEAALSAAYSSEDGALAGAGNAQEGRLAVLRGRRDALEAEYTSALAALAQASQDLESRSARSAENRRRAEALREELGSIRGSR